jgi:hypothetical protein
MLQAFRVKPTSRQEIRNTSTPLTHHNSQPVLPFNNNKIKSQRYNQQQLDIRPLKSKAQVSRKRMEAIPLLKNLRLDNDKVSILRSTQN